jgi:glycosyltransferase involved in cell wall biosynthesis
MANVIRAYLGAELGPWQVEALSSYSAKSRLRWAWRFLVSAWVLAFRRRVDLCGVHLHASERFDIFRSLVLLEIARRRRIPRVLTLHGARFMEDVRDRPRLVEQMVKRADAVTALSEEVGRAVREIGVDRVRFLPNPVAVKPAPHGLASRKQVLFAGEIGRRKGVDVLLRAWPSTRAECPDATLFLVGPVADRGLVAALPPGATYGGVLDAGGVALALDESRLAVLPSRAEAMPMFLLEAMAAGVPVVGTPVGSVESVVADAGAIVAVGDADALASAMVELLTDDARLEAMSRAAQRRVEASFSTQIFAQKVSELYAETFLVTRSGR